jgi:serine/threonine protein kinase
MSTLSPERWQEISPYLDYAFSLSEEARRAWLKSLAEEKPEAARLLRELLEEHRALAEDRFLEGGSGPIANEASMAGQMAGQTIGPYTVISPIGRGGMGSVWLAERSDGRFERRVAIKLLNFSVATGGAERFKREGRILGQLAHPHIAELIDAGVTAKGEPYLVLEHVEGEHIDEYCDNHRLAISSRVRLLIDVAAAVALAHANLIVHRDIKPSNVLVRKDGEAKLLDFGIAKLLADDSTSGAATQLTLEAGGALTPQFAAPEQITGEAITTATDVYSLGVLSYFLLTGKHPAGANAHSAAELVNAITGTEPLRPSATVTNSDRATAEKRSTTPDRLRRQLSGDLDTILRKALKKEPLERYRSVVTFADDLRRYLEREPISARPDSFTYRARKFVLRNKLGVALAASALFAAGTAIITIEREARRAEYRFQQVQRLAHTVLFDLNPQIENLAGATPARELLVKTSLEYLDSLAAEARGDVSLQIELANAYEKIGDVQGNSRYSNLGHPEASVESYRKAAAIAQKLPPRSLEALELLAGAYTKIGTVQATELGNRVLGRQTLQKATEFADSIPALTKKPDYLLRVEAYGLLGDIDEINDPQRAAAPIQRALNIAREWARADSSAESKMYIAILTKDWADIQWATGDLSSARGTLLDSLAIFNDLMNHDPSNAEWRTQQSVDWERMGLVSGHPDFFNLGDRKTAAAWLEKVIQGDERNFASDPKDIRAQFGLSEAMGELAAVYRDSDAKRSEKLYRRSLELSASALSASPQDSDMLYWQAFERVGFARLLSRLGNRGEEADQLNRAINVLEGLVTRDPAEISAHQLLGAALQGRAAYLVKTGRIASAEKDLARSEELLASLYRENSNNLSVLRDLANCYRAKGNLAAQLSQWQDARHEYQRSFDLWQHWLQIGKSSAYDRRQRELAASLLRLADGRVRAAGNGR